MSKIRVVTDSGADLSPDLAARHGIKIVPLAITFGSERFKDGVDLSKEAFFERLATAKEMPFTTQPSPADFAAAYEALKAEGAEHIISIHLSSSMSGTFQSATIGAGQVEGVQVHFFDSLSPSLGVGYLVLEAAKMAAGGASPEAILEHVKELRAKQKIYFTVDTLEYLAKNGRIGKAQAFLGGVLNIKPVLTITDDGYVGPFAKVRGKKKALDTIIEAVVEHTKGQPFKGCIVHAMVEEDALALRDRLLERLPGSEIMVDILGPTIGTHVGHGAMGVIAFAP